MKKTALSLLLICIFLISATIPTALAQPDNTAFLQSELKEASRKHNDHLASQAQMKQFIQDWQEKRGDLAKTGAELRQFINEGERIQKNNLIKTTLTMGLATYETSKDAIGLGTAAAGRAIMALGKWGLEKASGETGKALSEYGGAAYYNKAMTPFTTEIGKSLPELQELQRILAMDIPEMQALLQKEEAVKLTTANPTILAKWRLLLEKASKGQDALANAVREGDKLDNNFKNELVNMETESNRLNTQILDLQSRLNAAVRQEAANTAKQEAQQSVKSVAIPTITVTADSEQERRDKELKQAYGILSSQYPSPAQALNMKAESYRTAMHDADTLLKKSQEALDPYQHYPLQTDSQIRTKLAQMSLNDLASIAPAANGTLKNFELITANLHEAQDLLAKAEAAVKSAASDQAQLDGLEGLDTKYSVYPRAKLKGWDVSYKNSLASTLPTALFLEPVLYNQTIASQLLKLIEAAKIEQESFIAEAELAAATRIELLEKQLAQSKVNLETSKAGISKLDLATAAVAASYDSLLKKSGYYTNNTQSQQTPLQPALQFDASPLEKELTQLVNDGAWTKLPEILTNFAHLQREAQNINAAYKNSTVRANSFVTSIQTDLSPQEIQNLNTITQHFPGAAKLAESYNQTTVLQQQLEQDKLIKTYSTISGLETISYNPLTTSACQLYQLEQDVEKNSSPWLKLDPKDFALQLSNVQTIIESRHYANYGLEPALARLNGKLTALKESYNAAKQSPTATTKPNPGTSPSVEIKPTTPHNINPATPILPADYHQQVRDTLATMITAYQQENLTTFMQLVSPSFLGDNFLLDRALRRDFRNFDNINLRLSATNIQTDPRGRALVNVRYNRSVIAQKDGITYSDHGIAQFTFHLDKGKIKLYDMKYPILFGVSEASLLATGEVRSAENSNILAVNRKGDTAVLPYNEARNISEQSSIKRGMNIRLQFAYTPLSVQGWSFEDNRRTSSSDYHCDGDMVLRIQWLELLPGTSYRQLSAVDVNDVTEVPNPSVQPYTSSPDFPASPDLLDAAIGKIYALKLSNGKYAVIKIVDYIFSHGTSTLYFDYKYQPSGSRIF